ncbi:MAG: hypothetical protein ABW352_19045 [Polyangiales bacterium]
MIFAALTGCADESMPEEAEPAEAPLARSHARSRGRANFIGVYRADTATWQLRLQRPGWKEAAGERSFVYGAPGDLPVVGDWNGDGVQTQGAFRDGTWSLSDVLGAGPTSSFRYGAQGDTPIVGDWNGDGTVTVGYFRDGAFKLRNSNSEGTPDLEPRLGGPGDVPLAGDWDGDGTDNVGVYTPRDGTFRLLERDESVTTIALGIPDAQPVVGDWDDDGRTTVGVRKGSRWSLLNHHGQIIKRDREAWSYGEQAEVFTFGEVAVDFGLDAGAVPVVGNWEPDAGTGFVESPAELRDFFPLAADFQRPESFESWKDAGINTVIRVRSASDPDAASPQEVDEWTRRANELGLKMIRAPRDNPADDRNESNLLAYSLLDEPDIYRQDPYEQVARLADAARAEGLPRKPVFVNFAGGPLLIQNFFPPERHGPGDANPTDFYSRYLDLQDWASQDLYPISQMYDGALLNEDDAMRTLPLTLDKLRRWSPSRPQFTYLETGQVNKGATRQLTREEFRAQVWLSIARGSRGLFYFPNGECTTGSTCPNPDITPAAVRDELRTQNLRITELRGTLQGTINPAAFGVTAAFPLETGWRAGTDGNLIIAVNYSRERVRRWLRIDGSSRTQAIEVLYEGRTLEAVGGYTFADDFEPYAVHLYRFR